MPKADKDFLLQHSEMSLAPKEEYKQRDTSNKGVLSTHRTGSPCPSPYEASSDACGTKYANYRLEKLSFWKTVTNFSGVIKDLEQAQQEQTQIMDLQCDDMVLEKVKGRGKLLLHKGNLHLDDVTRRMKWNQKKQPTQINDSYYETISLKNNFQELKPKTVQQQHLGKTLNKLKKDTEEQSERKGKFTKEKNEARSWLMVMQETLFSAIKCLEDAGTEKKKALLKHVEELKSAYYLLQIKHEAELKTRLRRQHLEMDHTMYKTDKKTGELQRLRKKQKREAKTVTSALHMKGGKGEYTEIAPILANKIPGRKGWQVGRKPMAVIQI